MSLRDSAEERDEFHPVPPTPGYLNARQLLAAIVEGSDDAILTKDLNGVITSWNRGAEKLFGYTADEMIGRPVMTLIPQERHDEEPGILARIRRGEHVDHYETIRQRKDGTLLHISLTVSPLRDDDGTIIGASKIARDISERFRAQEQQRLLFAEMQHRIKNVFAVANGLIRLCAARAETPAEMAQMAQNRLQALANAHSLTVPAVGEEGTGAVAQTTLRSLLGKLVAPHAGEKERLSFRGEDIALTGRVVTPLALVFNELVTNAMKHGALRDDAGCVEVECRREGDEVVFIWNERMDDPPNSLPETSGFGTRLSRITVEHQLGGSIVREWGGDGLCVTIRFADRQLA